MAQWHSTTLAESRLKRTFTLSSPRRLAKSWRTKNFSSSLASDYKKYKKKKGNPRMYQNRKLPSESHPLNDVVLAELALSELKGESRPIPATWPCVNSMTALSAEQSSAKVGAHGQWSGEATHLECVGYSELFYSFVITRYKYVSLDWCKRFQSSIALVTSMLVVPLVHIITYILSGFFTWT